MKLFKGITLLLLCFVILSCGDDGGESNPTIEIRLRNVNTVSLQDIVLSANGDVRDFGNLAPFAESDYQVFQRAWDTADISATTNGLPATIVVNDYTAATELRLRDNYTYELSLNCSTTSCGIIINLVND